MKFSSSCHSFALFFCLGLFLIVSGNTTESTEDFESSLAPTAYFNDFFPSKSENVSDEDDKVRHPKVEDSTNVTLLDTTTNFPTKDNPVIVHEAEKEGSSILHKASGWFSRFANKLNQVMGTVPPTETNVKEDKTDGTQTGIVSKGSNWFSRFTNKMDQVMGTVPPNETNVKDDETIDVQSRSLNLSKESIEGVHDNRPASKWFARLTDKMDELMGTVVPTTTELNTEAWEENSTDYDSIVFIGWNNVSDNRSARQFDADYNVTEYAGQNFTGDFYFTEDSQLNDTEYEGDSSRHQRQVILNSTARSPAVANRSSAPTPVGSTTVPSRNLPVPTGNSSGSSRTTASAVTSDVPAVPIIPVNRIVPPTVTSSTVLPAEGTDNSSASAVDNTGSPTTSAPNSTSEGPANKTDPITASTVLSTESSSAVPIDASTFSSTTPEVSSWGTDVDFNVTTNLTNLDERNDFVNDSSSEVTASTESSEAGRPTDDVLVGVGAPPSLPPGIIDPSQPTVPVIFLNDSKPALIPQLDDILKSHGGSVKLYFLSQQKFDEVLPELDTLLENHTGPVEVYFLNGTKLLNSDLRSHNYSKTSVRVTTMAPIFGNPVTSSPHVPDLYNQSLGTKHPSESGVQPTRIYSSKNSSAASHPTDSVSVRAGALPSLPPGVVDPSKPTVPIIYLNESKPDLLDELENILNTHNGSVSLYFVNQEKLDDVLPDLQPLLKNHSGPVEVYLINGTIVLNGSQLNPSYSKTNVNNYTMRPMYGKPQTGGSYGLHPGLVQDLQEKVPQTNYINRYPIFNQEEFSPVHSDVLQPPKIDQTRIRSLYDCPESYPSCADHQLTSGVQEPLGDQCHNDVDCFRSFPEYLYLCCPWSCGNRCVLGAKILLLNELH